MSADELVLSDPFERRSSAGVQRVLLLLAKQQKVRKDGNGLWHVVESVERRCFPHLRTASARIPQKSDDDLATPDTTDNNNDNNNNRNHNDSSNNGDDNNDDKDVLRKLFVKPSQSSSQSGAYRSNATPATLLSQTPASALSTLASQLSQRYVSDEDLARARVQELAEQRLEEKRRELLSLREK